MKVWLVILGMGLVTFATRLAFILWMGRGDVPSSLREVLRFVPPAMLAVLVFMSLFVEKDGLNLSPLESRRVVAAVAAGVVAWRTRKVLPTITVGMVTLWILQAVI